MQAMQDKTIKELAKDCRTVEDVHVDAHESIDHQLHRPVPVLLPEYYARQKTICKGICKY